MVLTGSLQSKSQWLRSGFLGKARNEMRSLSFVIWKHLTTQSLRKKLKQTPRFYCLVPAKTIPPTARQLQAIVRKIFNNLTK